MTRMLILGGSSWLGHHLTQAFLAINPDTEVVTTYARSLPGRLFGRAKCLRQEDGSEAVKDVLNSVRPTVVMNVWRGESDASFSAHEILIQEAERKSFLYYYFSSASAMLGSHQGPYADTNDPIGISHYGRFKAKSELALKASKARYGILRFACAHGIAFNRRSRTEEFLASLQAGNMNVEANCNFVQNCVLDKDLASAIVALSSRQAEGVFHLGPAEFQDEVTFKRSLASAFGFDPGLVVSVDGPSIHAGLIPSKLFDEYGSDMFRDHAGILECLTNIPELRRYMVTHSLKSKI